MSGRKLNLGVPLRERTNMLDCPIVSTTHDEALVQADWYEEQGMQEWADQIRHKSVPFVTDRYKWSNFSCCGAGGDGNDSWHESYCRAKRQNCHSSGSNTRMGGRLNLSHSKSRRGVK